jgi:hypothetical protein
MLAAARDLLQAAALLIAPLPRPRRLGHPTLVPGQYRSRLGPKLIGLVHFWAVTPPRGAG